MRSSEPAPLRVPESKAEDWFFPEPLDVGFAGFEPEAFAILERLRDAPHIEQYRTEKDGIRRCLTEPFKRFRDDLAVNWVLPNRLPFETEKNVFSRLLKNDFGAGGCHHHLWMAFYRPGHRRLTDVQLSHSITPNGFATGLFVGDYAKDWLLVAKQRITAQPACFLATANALLQEPDWKGGLYHREGKQAKVFFNDPLEEPPELLSRATGLFLRRYACRDEVLQWQGGLVRWALGTLQDLWPLYRAIVEAPPEGV